MRRALELAARAAGATAPNPAVGCVIVNDGDFVGEGYHPCAGAPHAEVFALRAAGAAAKGAAAYVTLEPCSHYGRTPPCAAALVDAGVARVCACAVNESLVCMWNVASGSMLLRSAMHPMLATVLCMRQVQQRDACRHCWHVYMSASTVV